MEWGIYEQFCLLHEKGKEYQSYGDFSHKASSVPWEWRCFFFSNGEKIGIVIL